MDKHLSRFLRDLRPCATERVSWLLDNLHFDVAGYLTDANPPPALITSVRTVVTSAGRVLVVCDPERCHVIPGGRPEPGETFGETVVREVAEEAGWRVAVGGPLGFIHFRHRQPCPPGYPYPYPNFLQLIYASTAVAPTPEAREEDGYELSAHFYKPEAATSLIDSAVQCCFLQAALTAT